MVMGMRCAESGVTAAVRWSNRSRDSGALTTRFVSLVERCWIAVHLGEKARDRVRSDRHVDRCEQFADQAQ